MSKNKTTTETAIQFELAINEWEAIGLSKDAWDGCIKKRQVLTLEEAAKVVKALDDGEEYDLHSCFGWSYIDPNALSVLDKWVEANANGDGPSGYGYVSVQGRLKKVSDHCIARLAKVSMRGFIFYELPTDIQRRIKNAKAKLRRADQPNTPKADPDAPLPTAPPEWRTGESSSRALRSHYAAMVTSVCIGLGLTVLVRRSRRASGLLKGCWRGLTAAKMATRRR